MCLLDKHYCICRFWMMNTKVWMVRFSYLLQCCILYYYTALDITVASSGRSKKYKISKCEKQILTELIEKYGNDYKV